MAIYLDEKRLRMSIWGILRKFTMLENATKQGQNTSNPVSTDVSNTKDINVGNVKVNVGQKLDENGTVTVGVGKEKITEGDTRNLGNINKVIIANGVRKIERRAFENCENLEEVVLNGDLGEISNYAFKNCGKLRGMNLPGSIRNIGKHAFYGCENLNKMKLGDGIIETFSYALRDCKGLKEISLSGSIKTIGWRAFSHFNSLKKVEISDGTEKISRAAFISCKNLETVKLPNSIKWIGKYAFQNCKNLKTVDTTLKSDVCDEKAFKGCENLELGDAFKYTEIVDDDRFYMKKNNITKIDRNNLPIFGECGPDEGDIQQRGMGDCWMLAALASITYMEPGFIKNMIKENPENPNLVDVTLQRELTNGVFRKEVYTLKKSLFKANNGENVMSASPNTIWVQMIEKAYSAYLAKGKKMINYKNINGGGSGIKNAYKIVLGKEAKDIYSSCGLFTNTKKLFNKIKNALNHGIPLWYSNDSIIKKIMDYIKCNIPEKVKDIDGDNVVSWHSYTLMDAYEKEGRYYIVLRNPWGHNWHSANTSDSKTVKSAYIIVDLEKATKGFFCISNLEFKEEKYDDSLNEGKAVIKKEIIRFVNTQNLKGANQITIEGGVQRVGESAFSDFKNLKRINIPGSVKKIGRSAFIGCENLEEVELNEGIKEIDVKAFFNCKNLKKITLPESVEKIGNGIFDHCENLEEVELKERIREIPDGTFFYCKGLKKIRVMGEIERIGASAFCSCESLGEVEINGKIKEIDDYAFSDCKSLKKISISGNIEKIGKYAFSNCESLEEIELKEGIEEIPVCAFSNCKSLKKMSIPKSVERIEKFAFYNCENLEKVEIRNRMSQIFKVAFRGCKKLKKIDVLDSVDK